MVYYFPLQIQGFFFFLFLIILETFSFYFCVGVLGTHFFLSSDVRFFFFFFNFILFLISAVFIKIQVFIKFYELRKSKWRISSLGYIFFPQNGIFLSIYQCIYSFVVL